MVRGFPRTCLTRSCSLSWSPFLSFHSLLQRAAQQPQQPQQPHGSSSGLFKVLKSLFTMCQSRFDAIEGRQKRLLKKVKKVEELQKAICIQSHMDPPIEDSEEEQESSEVPEAEDPFASLTAAEYAFFDTPFPGTSSGAGPSGLAVEEEESEETSYETEESDELAKARKAKKARTGDPDDDADSDYEADE